MEVEEEDRRQREWGGAGVLNASVTKELTELGDNDDDDKWVEREEEEVKEELIHVGN